MNFKIEHRVIYDLIVTLDGIDYDAIELLDLLQAVEDSPIVLEDVVLLKILTDREIVDLCNTHLEIGPKFYEFSKELCRCIVDYESKMFIN